MIDKEVRSASWKFGFITLIVLVVLTQFPTPYEEIAETSGSPNPVGLAMNELSTMFVVLGAGAVTLLGGLLGMGLVSSEVAGGTIFALLSRPVSRRRVFLTKYMICAAFLLAAVVLGAFALFFVAFLRGYPFDEITWPGMILAVFLMWLASLSALGTAILVSTLTRNVMASLIGTVTAVFLILAFPVIMLSVAETFFWNELGLGDSTGQIDRLYEVAYSLTLYAYWPDFGYFWEGDFYAMNPAWSASAPKLVDFIVCFFAAIIPLGVSLWLFNRKKF